MYKTSALSYHHDGPSKWLNMVITGIVLHHLCAAAAQTYWSDVTIQSRAPILYPFINLASACVGVGYFGEAFLNQTSTPALPTCHELSKEDKDQKWHVDHVIVGLNIAANYSASTLMWFPKQSVPYWVANGMNLSTFWLNPNARQGIHKIVSRHTISIREGVALKNAWLALWGILAVAFLVTEKRGNIGSSVCYMINGLSSIGVAGHRILYHKQVRREALDTLKRPATAAVYSSFATLCAGLTYMAKHPIQHPIIIIVQIAAAVGTFLQHYLELKSALIFEKQ